MREAAPIAAWPVQARRLDQGAALLPARAACRVQPCTNEAFILPAVHMLRPFNAKSTQALTRRKDGRPLRRHATGQTAMIADMESSTHFFAGTPVWTLALALAAIVAYLIPALGAHRLSDARIRLAMRAAWFLHLLTLAAGLLTEPARFGFAPALSMTAWLMLTVYAIEQQLYPKMRVVGVLSMLGALAVLLAQLFPGKPMAVSASAWLPLHLALGIASYGLCAAAVVHAGLMSRAERRMRSASQEENGMPLLMLERLTFRFVTASFVLLTATLLAGWFFGEVLYGRAWHWDHKTVFSLLAWFAFAGLLIARSRFGLRGRHAVHLIYAGAALLLLAYAGSRFVLEVVLLGRHL